MKLFQKLKPKIFLVLAATFSLTGVAGMIPAKTFAQCADGSDGQLVVILSKSPNAPVTVTAKRGGSVPANKTNCNQSYPADTVTLTPTCTQGVDPGCDGTHFISPVLPYTGNSQLVKSGQQVCDGRTQAYQSWSINVSGAVEGTGSKNINCGGIQQVNITVFTPAQASTKLGVISGQATDGSGNGCSQGSLYELLPPTVKAGDPSTDVQLPISGPTSYKVSNVKPGTYNFRIDCVPAGAAVGQNGTWYPTQKITVTAGKNTTANFGPPPANAKDPASGSGTTKCNFGDNTLSWIMCPVVQGMVTFINTADNFISDSLTFDTTSSTSVFSTSNTGKQYYAAWNSFRVLATAFLIIGGLVMVASEAIGFEFLDAYTVRKVLPRLIIAVIGISLSWPLMQFVVQFFNVLGVDIRNLIYAPFSSIHDQLSTGTIVVGLSGLLFTGIFLGILGALSFGVTALLAIFTGFVIIVVRDIALILVIILAPLAIAAYILPNTQKVWKLWIDNFLGLLLMFPIIEGFIAIGHVFAAISLGPNGANVNAVGTGILAQIIGFAAYFAPYFLLPVAFRLATGAIGTIAGFVNDRGRGAFDRLKKYRGNKIATNSHAMSQGTRFNNRGLNALTSRATTRGFGLTSRGKEAYNQKLDVAAGEFAKSSQAAGIQHNDGALRAMTYGSYFEAKANMKKDWGMNDADIDTAINAAKAAGGFGRARQVWAAQQLSATGTGYDNLEQVAQTISRASHGNESQIASLAGNINSGTKSAGRHDLAPGFKTLNSLARAESSGATAGLAAAYGEARESAWASGSLYQHANDKGQNIQNAIDYYTGQLTSSKNEQRTKAGIFFNELKSMQPNASGDVKDRIQKALDNNRVQIDNLYNNKHTAYLGDSPTGIADKSTGKIETYRRNPLNGDMEKEVVSTGTRNENALERVERLSRTYERPNPNNL